IYAITDPVAERVRKLGGTTLRSIGQIGRSQRVLDNDAEYVTPLDMLAELREDNMRLAAHMRETHVVCDEHGDVATASLLEVWIDEAERRVWVLFEASRRADTPGRWGEWTRIENSSWRCRAGPPITRSAPRTRRGRAWSAAASSGPPGRRGHRAASRRRRGAPGG